VCDDDSECDKNVILRVEGKLESPTVFMFLKAESEAYPLYRIENRADETLQIAQKGADVTHHTFFFRLLPGIINYC
jgi:hypothetical protein